MKNLFDFATRELSQDAFLRWLFENYDDPELRDAAGDLLQEFCGIDLDEVKDITSKAQWCNIDVVVRITLQDNTTAELFIEDKTYSQEHEQLQRYDSHIDQWCKSDRIYKIFYKTDVVRADEKTRVKGANGINPWRVYSIEKILPLFEKYIGAKNLILRQYAEHVVHVYRATQNTAMPEGNDSHIDYLKWIAYFEKTVKPQLSEYEDRCAFFVTKAGPYPYVYMSIWKSGYDKKVPTLEIRSRDCLPKDGSSAERNINIRFLCYGMPVGDIPQQQELIEKIRQNGFFDTKGMVLQRGGKTNYFPKQIGCLPNGMTVANEEAFLKKLKDSIGCYLELMQDWR